MPRIWMSQMLDAIADLGRQYLSGGSAHSTVETAGDLCRDLLSENGEASGTALAREVIGTYGAMDEESKRRFLDLLAVKFTPDGEAVAGAAAAYLDDPTPEAYRDLSAAVASPLQELLHRMNMAPGGTAAIVRMRELVLRSVSGNPALKTIDEDLRHVFNSWFNRGFLQFEQVDWRTPAVVLEKLIAYEAVHEIHGWNDLRRRLAHDRRCFAFFHPALPDEPLIFVEVALTSGLAATIQPLLDLPAPDASADTVEEPPDSAIFYSISNCQAGLAGISFGNFLIKQVVDALTTEFPHIRNFATLSPIPGICRWIGHLMDEAPPDFLNRETADALALPHWNQDDETRRGLERPLLRLCAHYLTGTSDSGLPIDPVARFHLGNGASVERINWAGDLSGKGLDQSAGIMVNYRYDPDQIVANHEAFVSDGKIAMSSSVKSLL